ncbi:MAG: glycosyltransferase [Chlorobium sp.]|nr:MAG: glycosyltransferase family 4 protein [Chlorobium sp.]
MKKRILILSASFFPDNSPRSFRTTELAKELSRQGHEVVVYISKGMYDYKQFEVTHKLTIKDYGHLYFKQINITGNSVYRLLKKILNRTLLQFFEYPDIEYAFKVNSILRKESVYDMLISIAVPHSIHWGVSFLAKNIKKRTAIWIADCGDPFMFCDTSHFKKMPYFSVLEKRFCKYADYITVPTEASKNGYFRQFQNKIRVIPQGFNFEDISIYSGEIKNTIPTFAYAGSFIPKKRDPKEFFDYLYSLKREFKFIIYTSQHEMINKHWKILDKRKIELRQYINRNELLYNLSKMDFLVNFENNTVIQTPSKLIDYALTKRPVLSVTTGSLNCDIVNQFLDGNYHQSTIIPNIQIYNIKNVAAKFLSLC